MYESSICVWPVWMETNIKLFFILFYMFEFFFGGVCQFITPYYGGGLRTPKKLLRNIWTIPKESSDDKEIRKYATHEIEEKILGKHCLKLS